MVQVSSHPRRRVSALTLIILLGCSLLIWVASAPPAEARGLCTVYADDPHLSRHSPTPRINAIGRVQCNYNPSGSLRLQVRLQRRNADGSWVTQTTQLSVLNQTSTYVRHSRSMSCRSGSYRTQSRAYAAGPQGQPAQWSLWATGFTRSTSC